MFPAFPLRKGCISLILLCLAPTIYLIIALGGTNYSNGPENFSPRRMIQLESIVPAYSPPLPNESSATHTGRRVSFLQIIEDPAKKFSMEGNDVIVVLHIQKTAGTSFEKFLVRHLATSHPCDCTTGKKRCLCRRPGSKREVWLFSRYSTGWICGLHADFTELFVSDCVTRMLNKKEEVQRHRRLFGTTFLRDPVTRVISEFRHVNRGATWMASRHMCQGRTPTSEELPPCFEPEEGWEGVTLDEFLNCSDNLAFNRQTRMLADLTLVGCYSKAMDPKMRDAVLLASAKENLRNLAFFGLKERMADSQYMFYMLFGLRFRKRLDAWTKSKSNDTQVSEEQLRRIKQLNHLDIQLYEYAATLFDQRIRMLRQRYPDNESLVVFNSQADNETVSFSRRDLSSKHRGSEGMDDNKIDDAEEDENFYDSDNDSDVAFDRERRGI